MHSWMYQVHSSKLQTCFFMLKADVINVIDHVSIEPIVQSRQLQWPILLKVSVRWYNHGAITCKRRNLNTSVLQT